MKAAVEFIKKYSSFALACHINPEGDAVGSLLAACHLLKKIGKAAVPYCRDPVPPNSRFLPGADSIVRDKAKLPDAPAVIVLDCGDLERVGADFHAFAANRPVLNIDHHQTNTRFGAVNWVDPAASSAGELIALLAAELSVPVSPEMATCIYTSILTDTGSFHFGNTTPRALRLAGEMVAAGAMPALISDHYYHAKPPAHLTLLAQSLATLEFNPEFTRAEITITLQMLGQNGVGAEAAEGVINFLTDVETVKIAVLYRQMKPEEWKVSFRSKGEADVAKVAERFEGGGHKNAAGCRFMGRLEEIKPLVRAALADLLA